MTKLEKKILNEIVTKIYKLRGKKANVWSGLKILEDNIPRLPDDEIKKFFQEIKEGRNLAYQTTKKRGVKKLKKTEAALKILMEIQDKIENNDFPKDIPREITQLYRQILALEMFAGMLAKKSLEGKVAIINTKKGK